MTQKYRIQHPGGIAFLTVENGIVTQVGCLTIYHLPPDSHKWKGKTFGEIYRHIYRQHWTVTPLSKNEMPEV